MRWEWTEDRLKIDGNEFMFGMWVDRDYFPNPKLKITPELLLEIITNRDGITIDELRQHASGPILVKKRPNVAIARLLFDYAQNIEETVGWIYNEE